MSSKHLSCIPFRLREDNEQTVQVTDLSGDVKEMFTFRNIAIRDCKENKKSFFHTPCLCSS